MRSTERRACKAAGDGDSRDVPDGHATRWKVVSGASSKYRIPGSVRMVNAIL
jgi:hypothetical protein